MKKLYLVMKELGIDLRDYENNEELHDIFQSLVYLLSVEGPLSYDFEIYKIGPYSQHANMEAQKIAAGAEVEGELTLRDEEKKRLQMAGEALVRNKEEKGFLKCLALTLFLKQEGFVDPRAVEEIIKETTHYDFSREQILEGVAFLNGYSLY